MKNTLEAVLDNKKVMAYLERTRKGGRCEDAKAYDLQETGLWRLTSGINSELGNRNTNAAIYEGAFLDAVVEAVEHKSYAGWYCSAETANLNNGYLTKVKPAQVTVYEEV